MKRLICILILVFPCISFAATWQWTSTRDDGVRSYMRVSALPSNMPGEVAIDRMYNLTKASETEGHPRSSVEYLSVNCETGMMLPFTIEYYPRRDAKGRVVQLAHWGNKEFIQPDPSERLFIGRSCKSAGQ